MTQQGRNMYECVTTDDKTLFVHLFVISVFVESIHWFVRISYTWHTYMKSTESNTVLQKGRNLQITAG
jgi:hypothetical protein